jgi:two-component system response regulator FixJ
MYLMVAGNANKVIAADLGISAKTVEIHRARVMRKMEVRSLAELVRLVTVSRVE